MLPLYWVLVGFGNDVKQPAKSLLRPQGVVGEGDGARPVEDRWGVVGVRPLVAAGTGGRVASTATL